MSINISIIVRFHVLNQLNVLPSFLSVKKMFRMTENGEQLCSEVEYLKHQLVSSYTNQLALIKAGSTLAPLKMKAGIHPATIQIPSVSDIGYTSRAQLPNVWAGRRCVTYHQRDVACNTIIPIAKSWTLLDPLNCRSEESPNGLARQTRLRNILGLSINCQAFAKTPIQQFGRKKNSESTDSESTMRGRQTVTVADSQAHAKDRRLAEYRARNLMPIWDNEGPSHFRSVVADAWDAGKALTSAGRAGSAAGSAAGRRRVMWSKSDASITLMELNPATENQPHYLRATSPQYTTQEPQH
ncbi:hypothetical protein FB45DRAFT_998993 [Roridomyces roridus]|uniref:Uncharacterized protein n=1 Tax=Roridomyces roridus TaxID=1738132 RepID=A0AAD7FWN2_9AGAR|nr:hypothetical protein FB45DRAFT_998993 [Roridomyces roridus]